MTSSECHQSDVAEDKSEAEIVTGSREQLLHLLAEAAEIEHMLMCSYLYAAFSLKRRDESGLTDAQGEAVERWRKAIMDVAVEEMGHLLIVANLTLAVGGRPHFARPNFPVSPGYFPAAVVVRLSGFSEETLDHFIFLERPQGIEGEDAKAYRKEDYSRDQAVHGLMPAPQDYATIGHLYEAIRANIRSLARWMGEDALFLSGTAGQVGAEDVAMDGVAAVGDVAGAMKTSWSSRVRARPPTGRSHTIARSSRSAPNSIACARGTPASLPLGPSPTIPCSAPRKQATTAASSTIPKARGSSISPARSTACC